jgi:hypothetical protein
MLSKRFGVGVFPRCEMCGSSTLAPHWYSIKTKKFRCTKCFEPPLVREKRIPKEG